MSERRLQSGRSIPRKEDRRFVTGRGQYVDDLHLEGMLHAVFVRSPYAHARVQAIDARDARKADGVVAVLTAEDLEGRVAPLPTEVALEGADLKTPPYPVLATDRVRYQGEAVAVVVAEDRYTARDAADLVAVDYEPLDVVVDQEAALEAGAPQLHDEAPGNRAFRWLLEAGDVEKAFREADVVVSQRLVNQRLQPAALETRGAVAQWNPESESLTVWVTSQNPSIHREVLARVLGLPEDRLRVISPDVGGGFGSKIAVYPGEAVVSHLARTLGRPVKWMETREENFQVTTHGRGHVQFAEIAAKGDGTILGLRVRSLAAMGAYLSLDGPGVPTGAFGKMLSGCYRMRGVRAEVLGVFTNTTPTDAYRGAGRPEAAYLVERMVDILARKLEMDPVALRRKNFIPRAAFPYEVVTGLTYDSGDYEAALDRALSRVGYEELRRQQAVAREDGRLLGVGVSTYVEVCGTGPSLGGGCRIEFGAEGRVRVFTGAHPHGQGQETSLAQIVADRLEVPLDAVEVLHGDTDTTPWGVGTFGSRGLAVEGGAALQAAKRVVEVARKRAALLLEAREEDVVFREGKVFVPDAPERAFSLWDLARGPEGAPGAPEDDLEGETFYAPENYVFPFGTHVCVVELDPETGEVDVLRYVAVDDVGTQVNPLLVDGQVHGGALQGIAQALWEEARYDEEGNLLTSSFLDYLVPTAVEAPPIEVDHTVTPSPHNPLGAKGVGEAATIGAPPAVVNAVVDALAPRGVLHLDMPVTPDKVWAALRRA